MFSHILYATDGSEHAERALHYTLALARQNNAEVTVVHAYAPAAVMLGDPHYDRVLQPRLSAANTVLDEATAAFEEAGIPIRRELIEGPKADGILRVAEVRDCDLIVLGARGLSDLQGLLLGSVSHKVIQRAHCPVLIVR